MKRIRYDLFFRSEPEGGYTVIVPSLPGCITYGENLEKAKKNASDAISGYVASLTKHKEPIPSDDTNFISSVNLEVSAKNKTYA